MRLKDLYMCNGVNVVLIASFIYIVGATQVHFFLKFQSFIPIPILVQNNLYA